MAKYKTVADRIVANSVLSDTSQYDGTPCWEWVGARNSFGYGRMNFRFKQGPRKGQHYQMLAHRAAIHHMTERRVTKRTVVMHLCNNPACVNPAHLKGGTQRKNMKQCVADGRHKTPFRDPEMKRAM